MISRDQLAAIAAACGVPAPSAVPEPWVGMTSRVYPLHDVVVKVPFDRPEAIAAVETDAAMAAVAGSLGVAVAEPLGIDRSRSVVPVPYSVFAHIDGVPLDRADRSGAARAAWEDVGRQAARVHAVTNRAAVPVALREFRQTPDVDPRPWVDELRDARTLSGPDAAWLLGLLDRLAPAALAEVPLALCHGDVNAANVLVSPDTGAFLALIDWAGAGWLDPAWDFAGVPLDVVPWLLAGHREVAPLPHDETAGQRILWCQLQTRLHAARQAPGSGVDIDAIRRFARERGA